MTRKQVIAQCLEALNAARARTPEDCDGTTLDMLWDAAQAAKPHPDVLARFEAAVAKTDFWIMGY